MSLLEYFRQKQQTFKVWKKEIKINLSGQYLLHLNLKLIYVKNWTFLSAKDSRQVSIYLEVDV